MHSAEFPFLSALDRACESRLSCLPVCSKGKGGKEGICWASFLVLRSGSTMPRHDLADFLCAFGQANYAARINGQMTWSRGGVATTCSSSKGPHHLCLECVLGVPLVDMRLLACSCPRGASTRPRPYPTWGGARNVHLSLPLPAVPSLKELGQPLPVPHAPPVPLAPPVRCAAAAPACA